MTNAPSGHSVFSSTAPAGSASTAAGPALSVVDSSVSWPSARSKMPFSTPTMAGAWVTLGKQPRRMARTRRRCCATALVAACGEGEGTEHGEQQGETQAQRSAS